MNNFIILKLERLAQYSLLSDKSDIPDYLFFVGAIIFSYVYGVCAFEIHNIKLKGTKSKGHVYNQYWLNGLGAFVGWVALYILLFHRMGDVVSLKNLEGIDLILSVVAFLGITGHIPYILLIKNPFGKI